MKKKKYQSGGYLNNMTKFVNTKIGLQKDLRQSSNPLLEERKHMLLDAKKLYANRTTPEALGLVNPNQDKFLNQSGGFNVSGGGATSMGNMYNTSAISQDAASASQQSLVHRAQNFKVPQWTSHLGNPWAGFDSSKFTSGDPWEIAKTVGQTANAMGAGQAAQDFGMSSLGKLRDRFNFQRGGYMQVPHTDIGPQRIPQEGNYMARMQKGGVALPGGQMQPIPGSDAVEFKGQSHDQGGIMVDPQTEVEGGETMDKVTMAGGGPKEYFFSSHLKKGGRSYAEHHKNILKNGGDQEEIDWLARMQEKQAGRDPKQVAQTGGYKNTGYTGYQLPSKTGPSSTTRGTHVDIGKIDKDNNGVPDYLELKPKNVTLTDEEAEQLFKDNFILLDDNGQPIVDDNVDNNNSENDTKDDKKDDKNTDKSNNKNTEVKQGNKYKLASDKVYGDVSGEYGDIPDYQPGYMVGNVQMYAGSDDEAFRTALQDENFRGDWMNNADPDVLAAAGITSFDDMGDQAKVTAYQNAWNEKYPDNPIVVDGKFGEQTFRTAVGPKDDGSEEEIIEEDGGEEVVVEEEEIKKKEDWLTPIVGAAQLLPAIYAFSDKPDYMMEHPMASAGAVIPERISKTNLDRIDMNPEKARNAADFRMLNRYIDTSGGGPSNMMNKMAAYAKKQQGDRDISAQETRANVAISNQEAVMDQQRKSTNVTNALDASKFNLTQQQEVNRFNQEMYARVDEFNRGADAATTDRRLNALDTVVKSLAGMNKDRLQYNAQERLAQAISGQTGVYDREKYCQILAASGYEVGSAGYNKLMDQYSKRKLNKDVSEDEKALGLTEEDKKKKTTKKQYDGAGNLISTEVTTAQKGGFIPSGFRRYS